MIKLVKNADVIEKMSDETLRKNIKTYGEIVGDFSIYDTNHDLKWEKKMTFKEMVDMENNEPDYVIHILNRKEIFSSYMCMLYVQYKRDELED